eukprot:g8951.t1
MAVRVAQTPMGSRVLQRIIFTTPLVQLRPLIIELVSGFPDLVFDKHGSHVLEQICVTLNIPTGSDKKGEEGPKDVDVENAHDTLVESLCEDWISILKNPHSSHVARALLLAETQLSVSYKEAQKRRKAALERVEALASRRKESRIRDEENGLKPEEEGIIFDDSTTTVPHMYKDVLSWR